MEEARAQAEDADALTFDNADVLLTLDALRPFVDRDGDDPSNRLNQPGRDRLERRQRDEVQRRF